MLRKTTFCIDNNYAKTCPNKEFCSDWHEIIYQNVPHNMIHQQMNIQPKDVENNSNNVVSVLMTI